MAGKSTKTYRFSPFGTAVHPWINTPDGKFKPDNPEFKVTLRVPVAEAQADMDLIRAAAQEALDTYLEENVKPADKRKWELYLPFEEEFSEDGKTKTGFVLFRFRQNSKIKLRESGEVKDILVSIKDMQNNDTDVKVFSGATIRCAYSMRPNPSTSNRQCGVRLDFAAVQVKDPGRRGAGGGGIQFDTGEGFVQGDEGFPDDEPAQGRATGGNGNGGPSDHSEY